jgi:FAD binding domain
MLPQTAIENLGKHLRGQLLRPGQPGYDEARKIWNGMIDKRPALIAHCKGAADVVNSVRFAREHDLTVAIRGGGHNIAGKLCKRFTSDAPTSTFWAKKANSE